MLRNCSLELAFNSCRNIFCIPVRLNLASLAPAGRGIEGEGSAAAHRDDDLQLIAVRQLLRREAAARHDPAVALQRDALAGQPHLLDEGGDADGLRELARRAVDADRNHSGTL